MRWIPPILWRGALTLAKSSARLCGFWSTALPPSMSFLFRPPMINMNTSLEVGSDVVGAKRRRATADSVQACPCARSAPYHSQSLCPHDPIHTPHQSSVHPGGPLVNMIPRNTNEYRHYEPEGSPPTRDRRDFLSSAHAPSYPLSAEDIKSDPDDDTALQPIRYTSSNESFADGLPASPHVLSHWTHDGSRRPLDSDTMHPVPLRHYPQTFAMHSNRPTSEDYPQRPPIPVQQRPHYEPSHHGQAQAAPRPEESHPITTHTVTKKNTLRATQVRRRGLDSLPFFPTANEPGRLRGIVLIVPVARPAIAVDSSRPNVMSAGPARTARAEP